MNLNRPKTVATDEPSDLTQPPRTAVDLQTAADSRTAVETADEQVVIFLSGDLMFASRVRAAADAADLDFQLAGSLPDRPGIRWVIIDLATRSGAVEGLIDRCQQVCPDASVLAYGPHVQVAKLEKAKRAGIPIVLTRGQFDRSLGTLFASD